KEKDTGKTCLMKALLKPGGNTEDIVILLLHYAEENGGLAELLNAVYTDECYRGQSALHIAIEKGLERIAQILVDKGADVHQRATGLFFQLKKAKEDGFYFGEYPLSLAACTNQPNLVRFLLEHKHNPCSPERQDSLGNTVLHALAIVADDDKESMKFVPEMYDLILIKSEERRMKVKQFSLVNLEKIHNKEGLTPLQLTAKEGKLQLFQRILVREFPREDPMYHLSRRFVEWTYGPICSSLYDLDEVDTTDPHSALKIVVYNTNQEKYSELLDVEPLKELLKIKWETFAAAMFGICTTFYLIYIILFTVITALQLHIDQEPGSEFGSSSNTWLTAGQIFIFIVAGCYLLKTGFDIISMWPIEYLSFFENNYFHVLFLLQTSLVMCSLFLYWDRVKEYVIMQALALVLGWFDLLYYSRGFKFTGIFTIIIQRIIVRDISRFICVYMVLILGFSTGKLTVALFSLTNKCPSESCPYESIGGALWELYKLSFDIGDMTGFENSTYPALFRILLIIYMLFIYVLLLNLLIALMGYTINAISEKNEKIWRMQRAITILDLERFLPKCCQHRCQKNKIYQCLDVGLNPGNKKDLRTCLW
uniref:Ion transport domain-containing protein n=1 Tax=Ornithorhynchus anatinus TaxID=9258 RepID=F6TGT3_ORNAN